MFDLGNDFVTVCYVIFIMLVVSRYELLLSIDQCGLFDCFVFYCTYRLEFLDNMSTILV